MKTINDLVNKLNNGVAYGEYYIKEGKNDNYLLYKKYILSEDSTLFEFAKKQPYWSIYQSLGAMHNQVQKDIMDFVYSTDKDHWFDETEKKYNIIIGEDVGQIYRSAYKKCQSGAKVSDNVYEENLTLENYQFTETEIEELKSKVSERSAKIIDLGKVEIKND